MSVRWDNDWTQRDPVRDKPGINIDLKRTGEHKNGGDRRKGMCPVCKAPWADYRHRRCRRKVYAT